MWKLPCNPFSRYKRPRQLKLTFASNFYCQKVNMKLPLFFTNYDLVLNQSLKN